MSTPHSEASAADAGKSQNDTVNVIMELMAGWNTIESAAKKQFPNASKDELFQICKGAMNHALGINPKHQEMTHEHHHR